MLIIEYEGEGMVTLKRKVALGVIGFSSLAIAIVLLKYPYYYWLGQEAYIPKSNPDAGYVLPKSQEAWIYFIFGVFFLVLSFIFLLAFRRTEPHRIPRLKEILTI